MNRVLLVEPDQILSKNVCAVLSASGFAVEACKSAQSAIMAADQKKPDLVILELQLVEHSGIEFLYEFRSYSEWQSVPVIIYSQVPPVEFANSWQIIKEELAVGAYLYKPQSSLRQLLKEANQLVLHTV